MLPGMGGFEAVVIALLALVIVGPKDLPILMRKLARWVNKVRGMAAEFRMSFDELARQSELDELRREVEALRRGDPLQPVRTEFDPIAREINTGLSDHSVSGPVSGPSDGDHSAYEAAVAEANGEAAALPSTPTIEPAPTPSPAPVEAAPLAVAAPEPESAPAPSVAAETAAPAAKRARRKAGAASVAGGGA